MKKTAFIIMFMVAAIVSVSADLYSKIAVVDLDKVVEDYYSDTKELRDIRDIKKAIEEVELDTNRKINAKELEKIKAEKEGNDIEVKKIELKLIELRTYLQDYKRVRLSEIKNKLTALYQSQSLSGKIFRVIKQIGESEGYTLIIRKGSEYDILYYSEWIDITDQVIARLNS